MTGDLAAANAVIRNLYVAIGQQVRAARENNGVTQASLAASVGLTRGSVANLERGEQRPPVHTLIAIGQALGVNPAELLCGNGSPPNLADRIPPTLALRKSLTAAATEIQALLNALPTET